MRQHIEVLGWLHELWGAFAFLAGLSFGILAVGTTTALSDLGADGGAAGRAGIGFLVLFGGSLGLFGVAMILVARLLRRHRPAGRIMALVLAFPNLVIMPFGTALGLYTFWVLLNDEARALFGRPGSGH